MTNRERIVLGLILLVAIAGFWFPRPAPKTRNLTILPETVGDIGFIGCSNTSQTVFGYFLEGGERFWSFSESDLHQYDGGAAISWAQNRNGYWETFDTFWRMNPETNTIWWQLCIRKEEAEMTYEDAFPVIEHIRSAYPNVTIYVSPLTEFTGEVCELTGIEGIERAKSLATELDERNEYVLLGPILGPLGPNDIGEGDDHCHPDEEGARMLGNQLRLFFDT